MGANSLVNGVPVHLVTDLKSSSNDAVILVCEHGAPALQLLEDFVASAVHLDKGLEKNPAVLHCPRVAGERLIIAPTGPITPYDDVRTIAEATKKGVERAIEAGVKSPILIVQTSSKFDNAELVTLLAAFEALYVPIQMRESFPQKAKRLTSLGLYGEGLRKPLNALLKNALALETALGVGRDIGGGDPERMTPIRVAEYVENTFKGTSIKVRIIDDASTFRKEYPLFAAVDRAANSVPRHRGRIIFLEYLGQTVDSTVMLVGKGVTYDTGGCDIKAGGVMAGMSRDKCGAAAVAGFMKACDLLKPNIKVVAVMSMVRNSVGEEAYVADEYIVSRNGKAIRVGNTDAEGRMIMADLLCEMAEKAPCEKKPHIYTIATLTGHAHRTVGEGYSIVLDNHVARKANHAQKLQQSGDVIGDMIEISTIRREDFNTHKGKGFGDDILQALNHPSTAVARGHQGPAAFLLLTSDLHTGDVAYSHLDIAASAGSLPLPPTSAPVLALAQHYKLIQY